MIDAVHYLVRHPTGKNGLIYPSELDSENYVGFGSFYLLGHHGHKLQDSYRLFAVHGDKLIETKLSSYRNSTSFFIAKVTGVGDFVFHAQTVLKNQPYIGNHLATENMEAVRRLRSWHPNELDSACKEKGFYFVGYSPQIDR